MKKTIITAAITGSLISKEQNPNIPITPEQIANAAIESWKAGAAITHLHVRDPESGRPVQRADLFAEVITHIRKQSDVIINVSTGGGPGMTYDERIGIIPILANNPKLKPEIASLNAGSVNFGIYSMSKKRFILDSVQLNPWSELSRFGETMRKYGIKPEIEIYEAGMIHNAQILQEIGALGKTLHFQFVLGVMGAMQATVDNLIFLKNAIPVGSTWSVCAVGLDIFRVGAAAIACGGNVRVGLEDTIYSVGGKLAESNAALVTKIVSLTKMIGCDVASPNEARKILCI